MVASVPLLGQPAGPYSGRSVQAVIDELRAAGAPLVYSTNLLPDSLRVTAEPTSRGPLTIAREVLQPHGLTLREEAGVWLVVRAEPPAVPTGAIVVTVLSAGAGEAIAEATIQVDESAGPRTAAAWPCRARGGDAGTARSDGARRVPYPSASP
jgi:hypothetical protein